MVMDAVSRMVFMNFTPKWEYLNTRGAASKPSPGPIRRMPGLDGLRALAILAVVWHHAHPGYAGWPISHNGFLGVDVFFVLSGFLITSLLLHEQQTTGAISLTQFYVRRSLRIFPLYYAVLALLAAYFALSKPSAQGLAFLSELPWHLAYASNWVGLESMMAITWSLSTEEQFYLVWPPVLALLGARSLWWLGAFLVLNQAVNFGALDEVLAALHLPYGSLSILQITCTPILLGVLLAFALHLTALTELRQRLQRLPGLALWGACGAALWLANLPGDIRGWPRLGFHIAVMAVVALVVAQPTHRIVRALEWRPLAYVGVVSYGVYLLHKFTLHVANRGLDALAITSPEARFALVLLGTVALAAVSYHAFEAPLLRLKTRFQPRRRAAAGSPGAAAASVAD